MSNQEIKEMLEEVLDELDKYKFSCVDLEDEELDEIVEVVKRHLRGKLALSATKE